MRNRHRQFRRIYGVGRRQMATLEILGGVDQFGKPRVSSSFAQDKGDKPGSGPGGNCICPNCGTKIAHTIGQPCNEMVCPLCGTVMTKE